MNQVASSFPFVLHISVYITFSLPLSHRTLEFARGLKHGGRALEGSGVGGQDGGRHSCGLMGMLFTVGEDL